MEGVKEEGGTEEEKVKNRESMAATCSHTITFSVYIAVLSRSRLVTLTKITPVVELMSKLGSPPRGSFPEMIKYVTGSLSPSSWSRASTWITLSP